MIKKMLKSKMVYLSENDWLIKPSIKLGNSKNNNNNFKKEKRKKKQ